MRITVVGAGSIGGCVGARLSTAGQPVSAIARGATAEALRKHGWRLEEPDGSMHVVPARAVADSDDAEALAALGEQDVVFLCVKAQAVSSVLPALAQLVGPETAVVAALNGVPWWFFDGFGGPCEGVTLDSVDPGGRIAAAIPTGRVVGCVVHMSSGTPEPGFVRHTGGNELILGEPGHRPSERVDAIAGVLRRAGFEATVSDAIHTDIWYKLWGNMTMNPVSALTRATGDRILADELVMGFCHEAMREAARIGARIGCPIAESPEDRTVLTRKLGAFRTSMLQDMESGRALELDALVGAVYEIGQVVGVATPSIAALLGLTRLAAASRQTA